MATNSRKRLIRQSILLSMLVLFCAGIVISLRPVPTQSLADCISFKGTVTSISAGTSQDILMTIKDRPDLSLYINRGVDRGLDIQQLNAELVGQEVTIAYPKYWTPLDPFSSTRHVLFVATDNQTIFDETRKR